MQAFTTHTGILATLDAANVDTDQIIAKQFLKSIKRTGFGEHLFHDWRYQADGKANSEFALNRPEFQGATILVARNNFGCGSSREHAVWAVVQYGFRAVIAPRKGAGTGSIPGFADIFRNNSTKNGLLTIELAEEEVNAIFDLVSQNPGLKASINLNNQEIALLAGDQPRVFHFDVDSSVKTRLLNGLDDIGITLSEEASIADFEKKHDTQLAG